MDALNRPYGFGTRRPAEAQGWFQNVSVGAERHPGAAFGPAPAGVSPPRGR